MLFDWSNDPVNRLAVSDCAAVYVRRLECPMLNSSLQNAKWKLNLPIAIEYNFGTGQYLSLGGVQDFFLGGGGGGWLLYF